MKVLLILAIVALLALSPALSATVPGVGVVGSGDVAIAADVDEGDDDSAMSLWDWLVVLWTTRYDDWPV